MNIVLFVDEHTSEGVPSFRWNRFVAELVTEDHDILVIDLKGNINFYSDNRVVAVEQEGNKAHSNSLFDCASRVLGKLPGWLPRKIRNFKKWISAFRRAPDCTWNASIFRFYVASTWVSLNEWFPDLVIGSYPFSGNLRSARMLAESLDKPFAIDYRDPWSDFYFHFHSKIKILHRRVEELELDFNSAAALIICLNETMKQRLRLSSKQLHKVRLLSNFFVSERRESEEMVRRSPRREVINVVFTGSLTIDYAVRSFVEMVLEEPSERLKFHFYGQFGHGVRELLSPMVEKGIASVYGPVTKSECMRAQSEADVLLMLGLDHPANDCVVSTKVYEYIATGHPILAFTEFPMGELEKLFSTSATGMVLTKESSAIFQKKCLGLRDLISNCEENLGSSPKGNENPNDEKNLNEILLEFFC